MIPSHAQEIREVSTDDDRKREKEIVHIVGERSAKDAIYRIPLTIRFESDLSSQEVEPVIGIHSTLRKAPRVGYTRFPVVWEKGMDGLVSISHKIMVYVGEEKPWPYDASIVIQVFAKVKSSEGAWRLEKSGSACLPLNKLMESYTSINEKKMKMKISNKILSPAEYDNDDDDENDHVYGETSEPKTDRAVYSLNLVLQSARMLIDKPFYKGKMIVAHKYGTIAKNTNFSQRQQSSSSSSSLLLEPIVWDKSCVNALTKADFHNETTWDAVNKNIPFLERRVMRSVNKSMAPFIPEVAKATGISKGFNPTMEELSKVHFPFFVTEVSAIPGPRYFSNYAFETDHDEKVYTDLMHIALERNHIPVSDFIKYGNSFITGKIPKEHQDSIIEGVEYNTKLSEVSSAFVEACTILSTSVPYIGDYVDFNEDRLRRTRFDKQKSHISTESCGDALATGADDCEGVGKLATRCYIGFRDIKHSKDNKVLQVAQAIANHYMCMGVLGSVTARNLSESEKTNDDDGAAGGGGDDSDDDEQGNSNNIEGITIINSNEDMKSGVGAHMWTMFFPKRHALQLLGRTWQNPREKIHWTDNTNEDDYPVWNERLPVLVGEGTGMLNPRLAPVSAYYGSTEMKRNAINESVKEADAMLRIMSGVTVRGVQSSVADHKMPKVEKPGELAKLQFQKGQDAIMEDRNARLSIFYRRVTALFPIVTREEEYSMDFIHSKAEVDLPNRWLNLQTKDFLDEQGAPFYSWRMLLPVQMGKKRPDQWAPEYDAPGKQFEFSMAKDLHWGVNIEDFIYKRDHIALMRMPGNSVMQEKAIGSVVRHLPPLMDICALNEEQEKFIDDTIATLNVKMKDAMIKKIKTSTSRDDIIPIKNNSRSGTSSRSSSSTSFSQEADDDNPSSYDPLLPYYSKRGCLLLPMDHSAFEKKSSIVEGIPVETLKFYLRSQDFSPEQGDKIISRLVESPYFVSGRFISEVVTPSVGTIRIEVLVNNEDHAKLNESQNSGFQWITDKPIY